MIGYYFALSFPFVYYLGSYICKCLKVMTQLTSVRQVVVLLMHEWGGMIIWRLAVD
jgi:hypothetical protein